MKVVLIILACYLLLMNLIAFICFGLDKRYSKKPNHERIAEATLLWLAFFGGCAGAILGMHAFHHKTQHKKFTILLPLILILHIAVCGLLVYLYLSAK